MNFNLLREKKQTHWTVVIILNDSDETEEVTYVEKTQFSVKERDEAIQKHLNEKYGVNGWLTYSVN